MKQAVSLTPSAPVSVRSTSAEKKRRLSLTPLSFAPSPSVLANSSPANILTVSAQGTDDVLFRVTLPELNVGDWLYFPSSIAQTQLGDGNGLDAPRVFYCAV